jgi:hypothetical protein
MDIIAIASAIAVFLGAIGSLAVKLAKAYYIKKKADKL